MNKRKRRRERGIMRKDAREQQSEADKVLPLVRAVRQGSVEQVERLLKQGVSANARFHGRFPGRNEHQIEDTVSEEYPVLALAVAEGHYQVVKVLLEHGADANAHLLSEVEKLYSDFHTNPFEWIESASVLQIARRAGDEKVTSLIEKHIKRTSS